MATVISLTAARMLAIEDSSVVSGLVDANGNLILSTHGGNTISAGHVVGPQGAAAPVIPDASTTEKGYVELSTSAEAFAGIDGTRATTPLSLGTGLINVLPLRLRSSNSQVATYNPDLAIDSGFYSAVTWGGSLSTYGVGTLQVVYHSTSGITQTFVTVETIPRMYVRTKRTTSIWTDWQKVAMQSQEVATAGAITYDAGWRASTNVNRKALVLTKDVFGNIFLDGVFEVSTAWTDWAQYIQFFIGSLPAGWIPLKDISIVIGVNVPAALTAVCKFVIRGQNTTSDYSGVPGKILWQSFSAASFASNSLIHFYVPNLMWSV